MTKRRDPLPPPPVGAQADFLITLNAVRSSTQRLAALARTLPEHEEYHDVRTAVGVLLNRIEDLEMRALTWGIDA